MFDKLDDILTNYEELMLELGQSFRDGGSEPFPQADEGAGRFSAAGRDLYGIYEGAKMAVEDSLPFWT